MRRKFLQQSRRVNRLTQMAELYRSRQRRVMCSLIALVLLVAGGTLLIVPLASSWESLTAQDLALGLVGCIAFFTAWCLLLGLGISGVAHQVLQELAEVKRPTEPDAGRPKGPGGGEWANIACRDGSGAGSLLQDVPLGKLSIVWRILILVPAALGLILIVLGMASPAIPVLADLLDQNGLSVTHVCLAGVTGLVLAGVSASIAGACSERSGPSA